MRMWMVDPRAMCRQHLLGEHVELHMLVGTIKRKISLQGYIDNELISTKDIASRHAQLVAEMKNRGMNHKSPLNYKDSLNLGVIDSKKSLAELHRRCPTCKDKYTELNK